MSVTFVRTGMKTYSAIFVCERAGCGKVERVTYAGDTGKVERPINWCYVQVGGQRSDRAAPLYCSEACAGMAREQRPSELPDAETERSSSYALSYKP